MSQGVGGPRTTQLGADNRRDPKTNHYCVRCHKELKIGQPFREVHLIDDGPTVLHPEDESLYVRDGGDMGLWPIGPDCAKKVGIEFTSAPITEAEIWRREKVTRGST